MSLKPQSEQQHNIKQPQYLKISAKKSKIQSEHISQCDVFQDIEIIENFEIKKSLITVKKISFPYIICLNQECDLETDYTTTNPEQCDKNMLHILIVPVFNFEQFLTGNHWGEIFSINAKQKRKNTYIQKIMDNEIPRYHYLKFPEIDMPELIIDFKHFFTINKEVLYNQIDKRMCSIDVLFRERINQRYTNYLSRIGLPVHKVT